MFKFKPEDFSKFIHGHECPNTASDVLSGFEDVDVIERPEYICAIANALLEAHLKTLPTVNLLDYEWSWTTKEIRPGFYKIWDAEGIKE